MAETPQEEVDRIDTEELAEQQEQASADYIEFLGEEPHGTTFLTSHTIPRGDALWKRNKLQVSRDLTWEVDPTGPSVGQKGRRMLLAVEDLPEGVAAVLEKTPGFKRVSE